MPKSIAEQEADLQAALHDIGLAETHNAAPAAQIGAWAKARQQGTDVITLLLEKKRQLLMESVRRNAASIATALRSWHQFAVSVLGYMTLTTLPPQSPEHAVLYLLMFANGATGANYLNSVVLGCKAVGIDTAWHDASVLEAKVAARLRSARLHPSTDDADLLISWDVLMQLVTLCDNTGREVIGTLYLVFWEFLLRVQSEGVELEQGNF